MKEFDIELARKGAKVCTRDGRSVKILTFERVSYNNHPIVALIADEDGNEKILDYTPEGEFVTDHPSGCDLFINTVTHTGYINLYIENNQVTTSNKVYTNKGDALADISDKYLDTIRIRWETNE